MNLKSILCSLLVCLALVPWTFATTLTCPVVTADKGCIYKDSGNTLYATTSKAWCGFEDGYLNNNQYRGYAWIDITGLPSEAAVADATVTVGGDVANNPNNLSCWFDLNYIPTSFSTWNGSSLSTQYSYLDSYYLSDSAINLYTFTSVGHQTMTFRSNGWLQWLLQRRGSYFGFAWNQHPETKTTGGTLGDDTWLVSAYVSSITLTYCNAPSSSSPANGYQSVQGQAVTLSWTGELSSSLRYEVQVSAASDFSSGITTYNNLTQTQASDGSGRSAGRYYWRVRVYDPDDTTNYSSWSSTRYFDISVPEITLDRTSVSVSEQGQATFQVKLSAQPQNGTTVSITRYSGDSDISVYAGSSLTFTTSNWNTYQTVTLAAASDADIVNGSATIRCSATGLTSKDLTATEIDDDPAIMASTQTITVPEGSTASFGVKLNGQPSGNVTVSVSRSSGDSDITVQSGSTLTFTTSNWNTYQIVTLYANEDSDTSNGQATILPSASGFSTTWASVTATEQDNDSPTPATATITVQASPSNGGTVSGGGTYTVGQQVQIAANANSGYTFGSWSDSGAQSHTITVPSGGGTYTATFSSGATTRYTLTTSASPSAGGGVTASPSSGDGKYDAGTVVTLTASANSGYTFSSWSGNASGSANPVQVTMSGNRSVTASFTALASKPDFTVTSISLNPTIPAYGKTFTACVTVVNQGGASGNAGYLYVYTNKPNSVAVKTTPTKYVTIGTLAAGAGKTISVTGLRSGKEGSKTFRAFADAAGATTESDENNNQATLGYDVRKKPDLVVSAITFDPARPVRGGVFSMSVTIKNQGTSAAGNCDLHVGDSRNSDPLSSFISAETIAAGASSNILAFSNVEVGTGTVAQMTYAEVDFYDDVDESDESNNYVSKNFTPASKPDFVITNISLSPSAPAAGSTFTAYVTVKNQGYKAGYGKYVDVWANRADAGSPASTNRGDKYVYVGYMYPNRTKTVTITGLSAGSSTTQRTLRALADSRNGTAEISETNNLATVTYTPQ